MARGSRALPLPIPLHLSLFLSLSIYLSIYLYACPDEMPCSPCSLLGAMHAAAAGFFTSLWAMMRPLIDPVTADKIKIVVG